MQCPKCGFQQTKSEVCEACGIIFAKYEEFQAMAQEIPQAPAAEVESEPITPPSPGKDSNVKTLIIVVLAIALGVMAAKIYYGKSDQSADRPEVVARQPESVPEPISQVAAPFEGQAAEALPVAQPEESYPVAVNQSPTASIEIARSATVFIETPWGSGSGFFVDDEGHIVTNRHVIKFDENKLRAFRDQIAQLEDALEEEKKTLKTLKERLETMPDGSRREKLEGIIRAREENYDKYDRLYWRLQEQRRQIEYSDYAAAIKVVTLDGREFTAYDVDYSDDFDLALLTLKGTYQKPIKPNFQHLSPGTKVYTIGNPSGLRHTVTAGIISGYRTYQETGTVIQTDAPINPGNSGGPLIDEQGRVLGVNTMILNNTEGIGFAISIQDVWDEFSGKIVQ